MFKHPSNKLLWNNIKIFQNNIIRLILHFLKHCKFEIKHVYPLINYRIHQINDLTHYIELNAIRLSIDDKCKPKMQWTSMFDVVLSFFQETFLAKLIYLGLSVIIYFNKEKSRAGIYSIFCEKCNWILIYKNKQVCQSCSNSKLPTKTCLW